jgi:hypothetical protein
MRSGQDHAVMRSSGTSPSNNLDPASYEANKGFLVHELKNTGEGRVLSALRTARDAQQAGKIVEDQFLRPGVPHGQRGAGWVNRAVQLSPKGFGLNVPQRRAALDVGNPALDDPELEGAPVVYAATGGVIPSGLGRALDTTESESAGSNPVTRDVI